MAERSVPDIAREALKLLATRRLPPTPENYQTVYEEAAGQLPRPPFPHKALRQIFATLPTHTEVQKRIALHFNQAINDQNWHGIQQAILAYANLDQVMALQSPANGITPSPAAAGTHYIETLPPELAEQLARVLENLLPVLSDKEDLRMHELTDQLVNFLRISPPTLQDLLHMLQNYAYRLSFSAEDQSQRKRAIQNLVRTVVVHCVSLHQHDQSMQSLSQQLVAALDQPWTLSHLDQIQQQLQSLLLRQVDFQERSQQAHSQIKTLLAESLQRIANLSRSSNKQTSEIENCAAKLEQSHDFSDMAPVVEQLVKATRSIASESKLAQAALQDLQERTEQEQKSIENLQKALDAAQSLTLHDPLTRALNSKGLEEGLDREMSRAGRYHTPISLASISLEGMHALGLEQGTEAVEHAQKHLAMVARSVLRPQDLLARDTHNHFYLLLPTTSADDSLLALKRLQDELVRRPLLCEDEKINLQISAGVVQAWPSESRLDFMNRADQSLHHAQMSSSQGYLSRG